jgi:hypothetical protein
MKTACRTFLFACLIWLCMAGCGGNSTSSGPPTSNACTGLVITGVLQDSLTFQPVAQGVAVLEAGTQLSATSIYNFYPTQQVATDTHGAFKLCTETVVSPSAIILEALDSAGKAYPPFIASISGAADLRTIPMGGCRVTCGFDGQQQTSLPATIKGVITSSPIAKTGSVVPQYAVTALDGSKSKSGYPNLWSLALPLFNSSQTSTFSTTAGTCAGTAPFCANYSFSVPSQGPTQLVNGIYMQEVAVPYYLIYAVPDGPALCRPPSKLTIFQQDGSSLLAGNPGAQITVAQIDFTDCE